SFGPGVTGYLGKTYLSVKRTEILVRPSETMELLTHVVAHELGHAIDLSYNTTSRRQAWQRLRGIPTSSAWMGCGGCRDFSTPAGDFAESFVYWQLGISSSDLAPPPSPSALA